MNQKVTVEQKKEFLKWFLKKYQMKRSACKWILNYLSTHDELLRNLHFVEESHFCPRAMVMSVSESDGVPFRFYNGNLMTADSEKTFNEIKLNTHEELYLQLNFDDHYSFEFLGVLEENPHRPKYLNVNEKDTKVVNELVEQLMNLQKDEVYNRMIDEALETGNKERFLELTQQMVKV